MTRTHESRYECDLCGHRMPESRTCVIELTLCDDGEPSLIIRRDLCQECAGKYRRKIHRETK